GGALGREAPLQRAFWVKASAAIGVGWQVGGYSEGTTETAPTGFATAVIAGHWRDASATPGRATHKWEIREEHITRSVDHRRRHPSARIPPRQVSLVVRRSKPPSAAIALVPQTPGLESYRGSRYDIPVIQSFACTDT